MSCWVVPAVAAELWGVSVQQVMEKIKAGSVISKLELGFLLVDIAPNGPRIETGTREPAARPRTWTDVELSAAELAALTGKPVARPRKTGLKQGVRSRKLAPLPQPEPEPAAVSESFPPPDADNAEEFFEEGTLDWRQRRLEVSRMRRGPGARIAPMRRRPAAAA